jgi:hypothetical protein
LYVQPSNQVDE